MLYTIEFTNKAEKELGKLPKQVLAKILDKIAELSNAPRPIGHKNLQIFIFLMSLMNFIELESVIIESFMKLKMKL